MNRKRAIDDLRKLKGLPPYDSRSNYVAGDGRFAKQIEREHGKEVWDIKTEELL